MPNFKPKKIQMEGKWLEPIAVNVTFNSKKMYTPSDAYALCCVEKAVIPKAAAVGK